MDFADNDNVLSTQDRSQTGPDKFSTWSESCEDDPFQLRLWSIVKFRNARTSYLPHCHMYHNHINHIVPSFVFIMDNKVLWRRSDLTYQDWLVRADRNNGIRNLGNFTQYKVAPSIKSIC